MIDNYKIGNQLSLLRREKGLTGEKFAEALGVSPQAVSKWENGKNLPETALLPTISKLLGASIDSILMPQDLLIRKGVYTNGSGSMMVVTKELNRLVANNRLDIIISSNFGGQIMESPLLGILAVQYQTPDGTFYSYGKQNDHLSIDIDKPQYETKRPFQIIGAFYGQGTNVRDVMQKIDHLDYFRWNEIHINHETFPSSPSTDGTDYLTLVYLNSDGIHVISCPEGGVLAYNSTHTALTIKDTSSCILPDIKPLAWGKQMDCCFGGAVTRVLNYMGETYTYEQIMGMSGACYRIHFTDVWDWSATDALVAYGYDALLCRAIVYEAVWADRIEAKDRVAERRNIVSDIQMGRP
ncbi:MAG: helix-turn-helix domain-containing protein, partial [Lachnospiraceae bacterium]|nr:helix-turn-helix domain-containing protein [Lachnospiraceae bacterium]